LWNLPRGAGEQLIRSFARYADMDQRIENILASLKAFALTRPVAYGAPAFAFVGALAGLAMQTGPQTTGPTPDMAPVTASYENTAEPTSWPAGQIPDYVIGQDFLRSQQPPPPVEFADYPLPPEPEIPPYVPAVHGPATPPPEVDAAPRWASARGDILDTSLPEDRGSQSAPMVMADAAATGMTTR
jgi:hypothetical protein